VNVSLVRVATTAFAAVVIGMLATAPASQALESGASTPQPLPSSVPSQGKKIVVPAGSVTFALGTSNGSIGDGRPRFTWTIAHGSYRFDYAIAYNLSDKPVRLRLFAVDAVTDSSGTLSALPDTAPRKGVGLWVKPYASTLVIPAKRSIIVPFKVSPPANAAAGDHGGALVLATIPSTETVNGQTVVRQEARIAMPTYVRVAGSLNTRVAFSSFKATFKTQAFRPGFGDLTVKYTIVNTGNVRVSVEQLITARGLLGVGKRSAAPTSIDQILPGSKYSGIVVFKHVPAAAQYRVKGVATPHALEPGSPTGVPAIATTSVAAVSWTAVALVTAGATIVVLVTLILLQVLAGAGLAANRKAKSNAASEPEKVSAGKNTTGN
jgi:hypothetical protein